MGRQFKEFAIARYHKAGILLMRKSLGTRGLDFDTADDRFKL
jgi:hypothetical protein